MSSRIQICGSVSPLKRSDGTRVVQVDDMFGGTRFLPYPIASNEDDIIDEAFECDGAVVFQTEHLFKVFRFDPASCQIEKLGGCLDGKAAGFGCWRGEYYAFLPEGQVLKLEQGQQWIPLHLANTPQLVLSILATGSEVEEELGIISVYEDPKEGKVLGVFNPQVGAWNLICKCASPERSYPVSIRGLVLKGLIGSKIVVEIDLDDGSVEYKGYDIYTGQWAVFQLPPHGGLKFPVIMAVDGFIYFNRSPQNVVEVHRAQVDWNQQCLVNSTKLVEFGFIDYGSVFWKRN